MLLCCAADRDERCETGGLAREFADSQLSANGKRPESALVCFCTFKSHLHDSSDSFSSSVAMPI